MAEKRNCEGLTEVEQRCSRTAKLHLGGLWLCHQHAQISDRDPARAKVWRATKKARKASSA